MGILEMTHLQEPATVSEEFDRWDLQYRNLDEQLVCPICRTAFVDPRCTECGHTFCNECLLSSCRSTNSEFCPALCPIDRRPVEACPRPAPFLIKHLLDELVVRCPYSNRGCTFEGKRWLLDSHVASDCSYVKVYCHVDCGKQIERRYFNEHSCACNSDNNEECTTYSEIAEVDTPKPLTSDSIKSVDTYTESTQEDFLCRGHTLGCDFHCSAAESANIEKHNGECPWNKVAGALDSQILKVTALEHENRALKRKMDIFQTLAKKGSTLLDAEILAEYDRIIHEVRVTQSCQSAQQKMIATLGSENARLNGELSHAMGLVDSLRRQMFHFSQSQRRITLLNSVSLSCNNLSPLEDSNDEMVKLKGKQKL